jgi:hypothetical protein
MGKMEIFGIPKTLGGWGLKNIFLFSKALATKSCWILITTDSLWMKVIIQKYIHPDSLEEWIRNPLKKRTMCSIIWKAVVNSFDVVGDGLAWCIGNGTKVRLGTNLWPGSGDNHLLPLDLIHHLNSEGLFYLNQIVDADRTTIWNQEWKD